MTPWCRLEDGEGSVRKARDAVIAVIYPWGAVWRWITNWGGITCGSAATEREAMAAADAQLVADGVPVEALP